MNEIRARILSQDKGIYKVTDGTSEKLASVSGKFRYDALRGSDYPAVGDYVIVKWPEDDSNAVIQSLFPRNSCVWNAISGIKTSKV